MSRCIVLFEQPLDAIIQVRPSYLFARLYDESEVALQFVIYKWRPAYMSHPSATPAVAAKFQ